MDNTPGVFRSSMTSTREDSVSILPFSERLTKGLTIWTAAIFMAGEMAGSGVLALPSAVQNSGWIGLLLIVLCCLNAGYTGSKLGNTWTILEERFPELTGSIRSPYPTIGEKAFGNKTRRLVSVCMSITLFGTATVFLLLVAQMVQGILSDSVQFSYCWWVACAAALLVPLSWLGTPKDFWPIAVGALVTTTIACLGIFIQTLLDKRNNVAPFHAHHSSPTFQTFCVAFGTILFAFGGASTFPTIQNDMKERRLFTRAVIVTFSILLLLYIPVAAAGYFIYGDKVASNIIQSLSHNPLMTTVEALLAVHLFLAYCIVINPFCQELEEHLRIPPTFQWKRCVFRTVVVASTMFLALSIPHFGNLLSLVGGSTVTLLTFVFPPLFYMRLCDNKASSSWPVRNISLHERTYLWILIFIGALGGVCATYSAIYSIITSTTFSSPCYVDPNNKCYLNPSNC